MDDVLQKQYDTLTKQCGFVQLVDWTTVVLRGADRLSLLQNMCTNDVKGLQSSDTCEAFLANISGKVLAHFLVVAWEDRVELLTVPDQAERIVAHLDRYVIREDVQLADESKETSWLLLVGPDTCQQLEKNEGIQQSVRCAWLDAESVLLRLPQDQVVPFREQLATAGVMACNETAWNVVRIESRFPLMEVDFDSTHLVQEVARNQQAVSYSKGCYLGQETVARIDALGHVNRELVTVKFSGENVPEPETELLDQEKSVGKVTSACWSPRYGAPLAIALLRRGSNSLGHALQWNGGTAEVVSVQSQDRTRE